MALATAQNQEPCPWCGNQISRAKFVDIERRIREQEQKRVATAEADARAKLEADRVAMEARYQSSRSSYDIRIQELSEQLAKAKEQEVDVDRRIKEAEANAVNAQRKKLEEELVNKHKADLETARQLLKADFDRQMLDRDVENKESNKLLQKQVTDLQRKLEELSASKPEVSNVNVFEALKAAGTEDRIIPLPRTGKNDEADILVEVMFKKNPCGKILIDSRARGNWQSTYATKLRAEMVEQKADHAILAAVHFPKGVTTFHQQDEVLVVHPTNIVQIVGFLRQAMVRLSQMKLTGEQQHEKKLRLYEHLGSSEFQRKLAESGKVAKQLIDAHTAEIKLHEQLFEKRGALLTKLQNVSAEVQTEINDILHGTTND